MGVLRPDILAVAAASIAVTIDARSRAGLDQDAVLGALADLVAVSSPPRTRDWLIAGFST